MSARTGKSCKNNKSVSVEVDDFLVGHPICLSGEFRVDGLKAVQSDIEKGYTLLTKEQYDILCPGNMLNEPHYLVSPSSSTRTSLTPDAVDPSHSNRPIGYRPMKRCSVESLDSLSGARTPEQEMILEEQRNNAGDANKGIFMRILSLFGKSSKTTAQTPAVQASQSMHTDTNGYILSHANRTTQYTDSRHKDYSHIEVLKVFNQGDTGIVKLYRDALFRSYRQCPHAFIADPHSLDFDTDEQQLVLLNRVDPGETRICDRFTSLSDITTASFKEPWKWIIMGVAEAETLYRDAMYAYFKRLSTRKIGASPNITDTPQTGSISVAGGAGGGAKARAGVNEDDTTEHAAAEDTTTTTTSSMWPDENIDTPQCENKPPMETPTTANLKIKPGRKKKNAAGKKCNKVDKESKRNKMVTPAPASAASSIYMAPERKRSDNIETPAKKMKECAI